MDRIPPLIAGICLSVYWASVIVKAARAKRWEHGANIIPPERIGRRLRLVWVPLVIGWCIQPWLVFSGHANSVGNNNWWQIAGWIGAVLCVIATTATFRCWQAMGKAWRIGIDPAETTPLIRTGPFRYVRHPIYGLSIVLMIGTLATTRTVFMLVTAIVHFGLLQFEAWREEMYLLQKHGDNYAGYRKITGRFIPRF